MAERHIFTYSQKTENGNTNNESTASTHTYRPRDRLRVFVLLFEGDFKAIISRKRYAVPQNKYKPTVRNQPLTVATMNG